MTITLTLTEHEASTITNALSIAVERFGQYAEVLTNPRLVDQFAKQAAESRALIERIDEAD